MRFNQSDTNTPRHLQERAQRLRDDANSDLDPVRRRQKQQLADEIEQQAKDASKLRM